MIQPIVSFSTAAKQKWHLPHWHWGGLFGRDQDEWTPLESGVWCRDDGTLLRPLTCKVDRGLDQGRRGRCDIQLSCTHAHAHTHMHTPTHTHTTHTVVDAVTLLHTYRELIRAQSVRTFNLTNSHQLLVDLSNAHIGTYNDWHYTRSLVQWTYLRQPPVGQLKIASMERWLHYSCLMILVPIAHCTLQSLTWLQYWNGVNSAVSSTWDLQYFNNVSDCNVCQD